MSESSNTTVSTVLDDSGTSSASSSSSSASSSSSSTSSSHSSAFSSGAGPDGSGKDMKVASLGEPGTLTKEPTEKKKKKKKQEEPLIMELMNNFRSILSSWFGGGDQNGNRNGTLEQDNLVEERTDAGYTSTCGSSGNSRKRRRHSPLDDDEPRLNGGAQKSKIQISAPEDDGNNLTLSNEPNIANTIATTADVSVPDTTAATITTTIPAVPGSLIAFTESKWREQSQTPSLGAIKPVPAPSGSVQLARSLARRDQATRQSKGTDPSYPYFRSSFRSSSRVSKRSATPMSMSMSMSMGMRSRRETSTPHRSLRDPLPGRWVEPNQYSPPSAPLNTSFRSSVGSVGRSSTFMPSRSTRLEQMNLNARKKTVVKKKPWLEQKELASGDSFDGESLMLLIKKLQENKVDGFENYDQMQERQKLIDEQIRQMRVEKPQREALRDITEDSLEELHNFLGHKDQLFQARVIGGCPINPRNLKTLTGSQWLNDEVINAYICLIKERANKDGKLSMITMNSTFVTSLKEGGYKRVARWAKRQGAAGEQLMKLDGVIIPIHRNFHWTLAFVNVAKKRFEYYDSLAGNWDPISLLRVWMKEEVGKKYKDEEWEDFYMRDKTPQQGNGVDCGVFLCKTAEVIVRGGVMSFSQKDIPKIRKMMQVELLKGDLAAV